MQSHEDIYLLNYFSVFVYFEKRVLLLFFYVLHTSHFQKPILIIPNTQFY